MDDVRIDRLTLKLSGLSEAQGRHLAMLIAQGLASGGIAPEAADRTKIGVTAAASASEDLSLLSGRVVADILRQLQFGS
jgi:hypothetical protein